MAALLNSGVQVAEFVYDVSKDGGTATAYNLHAKNGKAVIPVGAIIKEVTLKVLTAFESGGSATLSIGNGDSATGYMATIAVASLTAGAVFNAGGQDSSILWDGTNDHQIYVNVADAADGQVIATVGTAAMTAGKAVVLVEYYAPAADQ